MGENHVSHCAINCKHASSGVCPARQIVQAVGRPLDSRRPDTFRRSETQQLAKAQSAISLAGARNN